MRIDIPVVIFAGGLGTRMAPYSNVLPKPLLLYKGRTMLDTVLDYYYELGAREFYLILHHEADLIKTYIDSQKRDCKIEYVVEETSLGTAGGLLYLKDKLNGNFLTCNCDNLGLYNYEEALKLHRENDYDITIFVKNTEHVVPFGIIETDEDGMALGIKEKPKMSFFASTGIHIINSRVLERYDGVVKLQMPEVIVANTPAGRVSTYDVGDADWIDMSIFE